MDSENTILDFNEDEDLSRASMDMIPKYQSHRSVGRSFLCNFTYVYCLLCDESFHMELTEDHLQSLEHYKIYISVLLEKIEYTQMKAAKQTQSQGHEGDSERRQNAGNDGAGDDKNAKKAETVIYCILDSSSDSGLIMTEIELVDSFVTDLFANQNHQPEESNEPAAVEEAAAALVPLPAAKPTTEAKRTTVVVPEPAAEPVPMIVARPVRQTRRVKILNSHPAANPKRYPPPQTRFFKPSCYEGKYGKTY